MLFMYLSVDLLLVYFASELRKGISSNRLHEMSLCASRGRLCIAKTSRIVTFRAVDWTKCRHAQRMAALQCSSVALGVAKALCLMALHEIACTKCRQSATFCLLCVAQALRVIAFPAVDCTKCCHAQRLAALHRLDATLRATTCCATEPFAHAHLRTNTRTHSRRLHLPPAGPRRAIMKGSFRTQRMNTFS